MPPITNSQVDLERRLTLLAWLRSRLGYSDTVALLSDFKQLNEGFDDAGRSYACLHLRARTGQMQEITVADLERYDDNIREHLAAMNAGRTEPITLRYFSISSRVMRRTLPRPPQPKPRRAAGVAQCLCR